MYIPDSALTAIRKSRVSLVVSQNYLERFERGDIPANYAVNEASVKIEEAYQLLTLILRATE